FRKRTQKDVDRLALGLIGAQLQPQLAVHDGQDVIRRTDVEFIRLDCRAVDGGLHRHRGVAAEDFNERADMAARQMGYQREAHPGVGGHYTEQALKRLEPTRGGTYSDHRKLVLGGHNVTSLARLRPCARGEPRPKPAARQCERPSDLQRVMPPERDLFLSRRAPPCPLAGVWTSRLQGGFPSE